MPVHFVNFNKLIRCYRRAVVALFVSVIAAIAFVQLADAPTAVAGKYTVSQCAVSAAPNYYATYAGDAFEGPNNSIRYATSGRNCFSNVDSALRIRSIATANQGDLADFRWTAPDGTRFVYVDSQISFQRSSGHAPELFFQNEGGADRITLQSGTSDDWVYRFSSAERRQLLMRLRCSNSGGCVADNDASARIRNLVFVVDDLVAPEVSVTGPLVSGDWVSGNAAVSVSGTDVGSGVAFISLRIGSMVANPIRSAYWDCGFTSMPDVNGLRTGIARKLRACAMSDETPGATDVEPRQASWLIPKEALPEGRSKVFACAKDLAHVNVTGGFSGPNPANETCVESTIRVDHTPPEPPSNLRVVGGDGWRTENSFSLSWDELAEDDAAPVTKVRYRITGTDHAGEQHDTGGVVVDSVDGLEDLAVPGGPGEYHVRVWLEDAAGNHDPANFSVATLRFDPTVPPSSVPDQHNKFLNKKSFPWLQGWSAIPGSLVPASGIKGYAVAVDTSPETDPCVTAQDPQPECVDSEITHLGIANRNLLLQSLEDGHYYVHVVVVAGNGLRSADVKRVALYVDVSDPEVEIHGWSEGWSQEAQEIEIVARDEMSGMDTVDPGGDGTQPAVFWQLNSGDVTETAGSAASVLIDDEGAGSLQVWARDVAGNVSQPISVPVLVDKTPPVAHLLPMNTADGHIQAVVVDHLSGVSSAWIGFRPSGDGDWNEMPAKITGDVAHADLNWDEIPPGTYDVRIRAVDRAGNETVSGQLEDGSSAILDLPDRIATESQLALVKKVKKSGRKVERRVGRVRVKYNQRAVIAGSVTDHDGRSMAGGVVEIHSRYAKGSKQSEVVRQVQLDERGQFRLKLPKGPSRTVWIEHPASISHGRSVSRVVKVDSNGHVRLSAPRRVSGSRIEFRGKVGVRGALTKKGHVVEVQVRVGKGWATVKKAVRTRRNGSYRLGYRFKNRYEHPVEFTFRARLLSQAGLPYKRATSKPVKVVVSS